MPLASPPAPADDDDDDPLSLLMRVTNIHLVLLTRWSKQVPWFSDLPLDTRIDLLASSWLQLLFVTVAHQSQYGDGQQLVFTTDVTMDFKMVLMPMINNFIGGRRRARRRPLGADRRPFRKTSLETIAKLPFAESLTKLGQIAKRFGQMKMLPEEVALARSISLLNADISAALEGDHLRQRLVARYCSALAEFDRVLFPDQPSRSFEILLTLPHIREVSSASLKKIMTLSVAGQLDLSVLMDDIMARNVDDVDVHHNNDADEEGGGCITH